jgi:branched-subunit amino acid transport protein
MNELLVIFGMFLVTFGVRYPILALVSKIQLPGLVERGLKYVPPVVLMSIISPAIFLNKSGNIDFNLSNAPLYAGVLAVLVAYRTKNLLVTIISGMGMLWLWKWIFIQL